MSIWRANRDVLVIPHAGTWSMHMKSRLGRLGLVVLSVLAAQAQGKTSPQGSEYRRVMPGLAKKFTVVAVDLRGIGGSAATDAGYDSANLAEDVHQLVGKLALTRVYVVGHDLGGQVAYAYARLHPDDLRGLMMVEAPLPGLDPWSKVLADPHDWHMLFYQTPRIPELLIAGRQVPYFLEFLRGGVTNRKSMTETDARRYAQAYAAPA
jgi:pimeloyl-ACP methyl ester carboxylesterase